ncbi:hypothetical protein E2542_SST12483 [Spatholobus suberectus]|nr:hypothetical protein E2542_SST12483 [Spatholobus suberectus]
MRKAKPGSGNSGMGMLLVLFPRDKSSTTTPTPVTDKPKFNFHSRSKSLLSKAQSTISICALLFFATLLLFTLSSTPHTPLIHTPSRTPHPFALQRMGTLHRRGTKSMSDLLVCHVADDTPLDDFRLFLRLLHRSSLTASSDVVFIFPPPPPPPNSHPLSAKRTTHSPRSSTSTRASTPRAGNNTPSPPSTPTASSPKPPNNNPSGVPRLEPTQAPPATR